METTINNIGDGNIINTGGRGNIDATIQISSGSTEGATSDNAIIRTEMVTENGNSNGDTEIANKNQDQNFSDEAISEDEKGLDEYVAMCLAKDLAAYNPMTIKRKYPKFWGKILEFCKDMSGLSEEMDDEAVMGLFLAAPRTVLPAFFDKNGIYVNTFKTEKWSYVINEFYGPNFFEKRVLAEVEAFEKAFEIFEKQ